MAAELAALGLAGKAEPGGVAFAGTAPDLYAANLHLRTASRVLVRIARFRAREFYELERRARRVEWERILTPDRTVRLRVTSGRSRLYHEGAIAQRLGEAITRRTGCLVQPDTDVAAASALDDDVGAAEQIPAQLFIVRFFRDECLISADSSGALLHQRGYRQALAKAPLRETLAAAMLLAIGWRGQVPLLDPFCGSGTIPIEAALLARRAAPGLAANGLPRPFAFQDWPDFDPAGWMHVVDRARGQALPAVDVAILGSDRDAGALAAARDNAARAGVLADLTLETAPLSSVSPPTGPGWLVTNPPYGVRVGERRALRNLYAALGNFARTRLAGWSLAMLSADRSLDAQVRLPWQERWHSRNGGIPVRLVTAAVPSDQRTNPSAAPSQPGDSSY